MVGTIVVWGLLLAAGYWMTTVERPDGGAASWGVRAIIGKGELHGSDMAAFVEHGSVYFAAIGGLGALLAKQISAARVVAYEELGPEALFELELTSFPAVVIIDRHGQNLHEAARGQWRTGR